MVVALRDVMHGSPDGPIGTRLPTKFLELNKDKVHHP